MNLWIATQFFAKTARNDEIALKNSQTSTKNAKIKVKIQAKCEFSVKKIKGAVFGAKIAFGKRG